jgi:hypothetical protein
MRSQIVNHVNGKSVNYDIFLWIKMCISGVLLIKCHGGFDEMIGTVG